MVDTRTELEDAVAEPSERELVLEADDADDKGRVALLEVELVLTGVEVEKSVSDLCVEVGRSVEVLRGADEAFGDVLETGAELLVVLDVEMEAFDVLAARVAEVLTTSLMPEEGFNEVEGPREETTRIAACPIVDGNFEAEDLVQ